MIECIFTIDYEIYGNGEGSLRELVYEPTERLMSIFQKWDARFVTFVEAAEIEKIEEYRTDGFINDIRHQVRELHRQGFEIGLHLHPQWYNARYENDKWLLDYSEYNLCILPRERIVQIVERAISYIRNILGEPDFTPLSFRAGNWLFQPTKTVATVLAQSGIKIDSSVFKGGLQRKYGLDYRSSLKNEYYWRFQNDVNLCDNKGSLIELPTYTVMVPIWKMFTSKRIDLQRRSPSLSTDKRPRMGRFVDYIRFMYPKKFDYCRMTLDELVAMVGKVIDADRKSPQVHRPLVAIGHTKDLYAFDVIDAFLSYLKKYNIPVHTFNEFYSMNKVCN